MSGALRLERFELPFRKPLRLATGTVRTRTGLRLALRDEKGLVGLGEATPWVGPGRESLADDERLLERVATGLTGGRLESPRAIDRALNERPELDRAPAARFALETALLDLAAQRRGLAVCELLSDEVVPGVEVNALLGADSPEALEAEAAEAKARGFGTVKVKVGAGSLEEDLSRVAAVRRGVGPEVRVRLDANGAWSREAAGDALRKLERFELEVCEQPVAADDLDGLRALSETAGCPIAADESLSIPGAVEALLRAPAAVEAFVLKPAFLGGAVRTLEIARRASASGVGCWVTCGLDGEVARAAAFHVACALPAQTHAHGLAVARLFSAPVENRWLDPVEGRIERSSVPGLGIEVRG